MNTKTLVLILVAVLVVGYLYHRKMNPPSSTPSAA